MFIIAVILAAKRMRYTLLYVLNKLKNFCQNMLNLEEALNSLKFEKSYSLSFSSFIDDLKKILNGNCQIIYRN